MAGWLDELGPLPDWPFDSAWRLRLWHNVPGPLYGYDTFAWRQPRTREELMDVLGELFGGWVMFGKVGCDGDAHWTLDGIRVWWSQRAAHAVAYREAGVPEVGRYFEDELPAYLCAYAFFVEHGRRPSSTDVLPDIDAPSELELRPPADLTSALELIANAPRFVTQRGSRADGLPFWGRGSDLDVPGPFRGGSSRTRVPGVCAGQPPFVYRQPSSTRTLEQLLAAACAEPLAFGLAENRLTADELRRWWKDQREPFREALRGAGVAGVDDYVDRELVEYLRGYLFVIEHGRVPNHGDELPPIVVPDPREVALVFREPPELPFRRGLIAGELHTQGWFHERNALNVPGMFYGAMTDTCGTGPAEAPENVALDHESQEFVFRQPRTVLELACVFNAARFECFDGYGTDGNEHWTPDLVRAWWGDRDRIREAWREARIPAVDAMFEREVPDYLRAYLFFLAHGRGPNASDALPDL